MDSFNKRAKHRELNWKGEIVEKCNDLPMIGKTGGSDSDIQYNISEMERLRYIFYGEALLHKMDRTRVVLFRRS